MFEREAAVGAAVVTASARRRLIQAMFVLAVAVVLGGIFWAAWLWSRASVTDALPRLSLTQLLAQAPAEGWQLARLHSHPELLVIQFPDLRAQARALNRAAALVEQPDAPRDRVLDDAELSALIARQKLTPETFYYGHDQTAQNLRRFFALAGRQNIVLTAEERQLESILRRHGLLASNGEAEQGARQPSSVLITFTRAQPGTDLDAAMRASVARHELSHGVYFTTPAYADHCRRFWHERLTAAERERFVAYLERRGYNPRDNELMINEAQAFLMHSTDPRAFSAADLGVDERTLDSMRRRFLDGAPRMEWAERR